MRTMPLSKETRVRVDGLVKIIAIVCPANGVYVHGVSSTRGLIACARVSRRRG